MTDILDEKKVEELKGVAIGITEEKLVELLTDIFMNEQKTVFNKVMRIADHLGIFVAKSLTAANFEHAITTMIGVASKGEYSNIKDPDPAMIESPEQFYQDCFVPAREKLVLFIRDELLSKEAGKQVSETIRKAWITTLQEVAQREAAENVKH